MDKNTVTISDLQTPALVVDLDIFKENIAAAEKLLHNTGKVLRPHVKTHRTPGLAVMQLGCCAKGITCATVGEAEAMVNEGIKDILLANEIVTLDKIRRFVKLASKAKITVAADSEEPIKKLSEEAVRQGAVVNVLIDIDAGLGRCGVRDVEDAITLAKAVDRLPGLRFAGIMGYEGRIRDTSETRSPKMNLVYDKLTEAKQRIEQEGLSVEVVSGGGTSTIFESIKSPVITEIQAGTYVFMEHDLDMLKLPFKLSAYITGTVISRFEGTVVVDVGRKSVGCDYGPPISMHEGIRTMAVNEEHTILACDGEMPALGEKLKLRPSQIRTTFNLHDTVWLAEGDTVIKSLPVAARGKSQ